MRHFFVFFLCLVTPLCPGAAFAQETSRDTPGSADAPVAYVYVVSNYYGDSNDIHAFAAAPDGGLTPVPGSPFPGVYGNLTVTGTHLYSTGSDGNIATFSVASNGALNQVASTDIQHSHCNSELSPDMVLDRTGTTLYALVYNSAGSDCLGGTFQSYEIEKPSGELHYLGSGDIETRDFTGQFFLSPLSFIGSDKYAYAASCTGDIAPLHGFERHSNDVLTEAGIRAPLPKKEGDTYCAYLAAADQYNHVAAFVVAFHQTNNGTYGDGPPQLANYTADENGNLTTNSSYKNMPDVSITAGIADLKMSPSGKVLAMAGLGLQIFHFNGSEPITPFVKLVPTKYIAQVFWDNDNHLYAIDQVSNELFVFTITPASAIEAAGSPYPITQPQYLMVLPKTPLPATPAVNFPSL
jgi:hypothetical protein